MRKKNTARNKKNFSLRKEIENIEWLYNKRTHRRKYNRNNKKNDLPQQA
jgi:hypothetical protein